MSNRIKITFIGGEEIGEELELEFTERLLIGRSRTADIRLRAPDVSGRHLEILQKGEITIAHNVSRYPAIVDGKALATGEEAVLHNKSTIEIGRQVRIRVDKLAQVGAANDSMTDGAATSVTRMAEGETAATVFGESETFATRVAEPEVESFVVGKGGKGGRVEESATRDVDSLFSEAQGTVASSTTPIPTTAKAAKVDEQATAEVKIPEDADTADDALPNEAESLLQGVGENSAMEDVARGATESMVNEVTMLSDEQPDDGETQEMVTRVGSMEELLERRHQLDRAVAIRHWRFGIGVVLCLATLGAVWFISSNRKHLGDAEGPFLSNGAQDVADTDIIGADNRSEVFLEYPRNDNMTVVKSPDGNEIEVTSCLGRDRDVPFRLWFKKERRSVELELSLEESFEIWMNAMSKERGFSFERTRKGNPIQLEFFDSVFDGYCEYQTQCGIPFMRADYTRTVGHTIWRGICYRFRCGDIAYSHCCEIPDSFWKRGESRLRRSPFVGLYGTFLDRQWDSPGKSGMITEMTDDELLSKVRKELSVNRPGNWPTAEKWINTLLVRTWGKGTMTEKTVKESHSALLMKKSRFYNERKLAYDTAMTNRDVKRMRSIFSDVLQVFGASKRDHRYYLINDPNVWRCEWSR